MRAAVSASQDYVRTARSQYKQGLVNYLVVIDAERTLLANQLTLVQDLNQQMAASIHVIKALGGGWDAGTGRMTKLTSGARHPERSEGPAWDGRIDRE